MIYSRDLKVFLSGAISSRMNTYKEEFDKVERRFRELGFNVYNPATLPKDTPWDVAMGLTLNELPKCDIVYVLKGYEVSIGANEEIELAKKLNKIIIFE